MSNTAPNAPSASPARDCGHEVMKIIQVIPDFGLGGVQKAACVIAEAMAETGHDVVVAAFSGGPRQLFTSRQFEGGGALRHIVLTNTSDAFAALIKDFQPTIVHQHAAYVEDCIVCDLYRVGAAPNRGTWITPVFGRPPIDRKLVGSIGICCVGVYTLYRMLKWLGRDPKYHCDPTLIAVPLTPFAPSGVEVSALDDPQVIAERRRDFGLASNLRLVVGRQGRNSLGKWHKRTPELIRGILRSDPHVGWLSIGMPHELGTADLEREFGRRFRNLPETSDFAHLAKVLTAMDVQIFMSKHGECFASSICETAGLAVPTIAFSSPLGDNGQAEQIIDGVTGYLVVTEEECEARILDLMDSDQQRRLKRSARDHCIEHWHVRRSAADLVEAYRHRLEIQDGSTAPPMFQHLADQLRIFAIGYRSRVVRLIPGFNKRLRMRVALIFAERWSTFQIARAAKRQMGR